MSTRLFVCYWNTTSDTIERRPMEFFCVDNGYRPGDIAAVDYLALGESVNLSEPTQEHFVMRVK